MGGTALESMTAMMLLAHCLMPLLVTLAACSSDPTPGAAPESPAAPPAAPSSPPAEAHDHAAHPHDPATAERPPAPADEPAGHADRGAPHGGVVVTAGVGHVELLLTRNGHADVWLLDPAMNVIPVAGATGRVQVARVPAAPLTIHGDHLAAELGPIRSSHGTAQITVQVPGEGERTAEARFDLEEHH